MKLVSVIIPVFNIVLFLRDCLNSLLNQSYLMYEIILVDDGSSDGSEKICDEYAKLYKNIKVVHQKNLGVSIARNVGILESTGEFIVFVDGDDMVSRYYLEILIGNIQDADCVIVNYSSCRDDLLKDNLDSKNKKKYKANVICDLMLAGGSFDGYLWNKIFKREIILNKEIKFPKNISIWEDMYFVLSYFQFIEDCIVVDSCLYYYRKREGSAVNNITKKKMFDKVMACDLFLKLAEDKKSIFYKNAKRLYIDSIIDASYKSGVLHNEIYDLNKVKIQDIIRFSDYKRIMKYLITKIKTLKSNRIY